MKKTRTLAIAAAAAILLGVGAAPAMATDEVGYLSCQLDATGQFFQLGIRNSNGTGLQRCWANKGDAAIDIVGVERVSSGNNSGFYTYYDSRTDARYQHYFSKWSSQTGLADIEVIHLHID